MINSSIVKQQRAAKSAVRLVRGGFEGIKPWRI